MEEDTPRLRKLLAVVAAGMGVGMGVERHRRALGVPHTLLHRPAEVAAAGRTVAQEGKYRHRMAADRMAAEVAESVAGMPLRTEAAALA